ncbi:F-box protein [Hibiscus syriacus]|uniref:F-box protein n=1 Tax=Hibiscus syriacus TaxID=106335 RepID=A0A6A3BXJ1_HIBSY|nr:F-box protein At1g67340-like [Hibiscus syriacus]KAE8720178.1 F-box protein [Hibiscus syriacus]
MLRRKKQRISHKFTEKPDLFDGLPDDLVISIISKLACSASSPPEFISILLTCKRINRLAVHPLVLSKVGFKVFALKARSWCDSVHRFLKQCVNAGNVEACYTLGMIRFYCLENRRNGTSLMAKAAIKSHAPSLYSLAVIQFNGSGGSKKDKDIRAGVALCERAAFLGHVDALRELGHCLQDGYGVRQHIPEGRRLLIQANVWELASSLNALVQRKPPELYHRRSNYQHNSLKTSSGCPLLSDFGCNVPAPDVHPVNVFLKEWFESGEAELAQGLRLCSHKRCGRPETRAHEFRRCSGCGMVNYCSRGCQALDWKLRHNGECGPIGRWFEEVDGGMEEVVEAEELAI